LAYTDAYQQPQTMPTGGASDSARLDTPFARGGGGVMGAGPGKREVDLYVRTYTTLLQSSGAIGVSSLEPAHLTAAPSLHAGAAEPAPDVNAFIYSIQRLPARVVDVKHIVLGQSMTAFVRAGFGTMEGWQVASAPGRRRKWLYDGKETLAAYIASTSDLDDLIPTIVAFQIEWNKFQRLFHEQEELRTLVESVAAGERTAPAGDDLAAVGEGLLLAPGDWSRLQAVWGAALWTNLAKLATIRKRFTLRMLGGTYLSYARAARGWWAPIGQTLLDLGLADRQIYFISSNTHSIVNVLSGSARRRREALTDYIRQTRHHELLPQLELLERGESRSNWDNLLYFAARHYFTGPGMAAERERRNREERERGIHMIEPQSAIDVGAQVIELAALDPEAFDPRVFGEDKDEDLGVAPPPHRLLDPRQSDAVIVNVNYPLGLAAYHILTQVGMASDRLRGVYILGKAATLNGRIGDVMLANVVYDEHSGNTYWFDNCFRYEDVAPLLVFGAALDNQKAVTVKGTFLQNQGYLDFYYRENYTVVEMEAGPYLDAIYEDIFLRRYPADEAINLRFPAPGMMDLGIIHYASDTPYTRAQTLGARGLSFFGMDSTYASTIAILRRVFAREAERLGVTEPSAVGRQLSAAGHASAPASAGSA
jgi:hypothetical protein